jgi:hypothetical protein
MVRNVWLPISLSLLVCLPTAEGFAGEAHPVPTSGRQSAYTKSEFARRGQPSNQDREAQTLPEVHRSLPPVYERRRATTTLREISDLVSHMKQRTLTAQPKLEFDSKRATETLNEFKNHVAEMKRRTRATQKTISGPIDGVYVHQYNRVRVPTPHRIEETSGLTHQDFADTRLLEKGYTKTIAGWVPPQRQSQVSKHNRKRKIRESVAQSTTNDPF